MEIRALFFEVRIMPSRRYRKNAEECRAHAAHARTSEAMDAWLATAEEWQKVAEELEADQQQSGSSGSVRSRVLHQNISPVLKLIARDENSLTVQWTAIPLSGGAR